MSLTPPAPPPDASGSFSSSGTLKRPPYSRSWSGCCKGAVLAALATWHRPVARNASTQITPRPAAAVTAKQNPEDPLAVFVVLRKEHDLDWPTGALINQACHACSAMAWEARDDEEAIAYFSQGAEGTMVKSTMGAKSQAELEGATQRLNEAGIPFKLWVEQPEESRDNRFASSFCGAASGFNGTIFAYGQTGAGKSHTMTGPTDGPPELQGLLPRSFNHIFNNIDTTSQDTKYLVRGSYLEIYNEEIRDLLAKNPKQRCELKDPLSLDRSFLKKFTVSHRDLFHYCAAPWLCPSSLGAEWLAALQVAVALRAKKAKAKQKPLKPKPVKPTAKRSSPNAVRVYPAEDVFSLDVECVAVGKTHEKSDRMPCSYALILNAGLANRAIGATAMNETSSRSHSIFMITVEQCGLGTDGAGHIRVGKLNMVDLAGSERQSKTGATGERLKEATKINLSLPADYNYDETASTLRYAYRAKSIKNKPRINEDPKDAMIREYQEEIMRLKAELEAAGGEVDEHGMPINPLVPRVEKQVEYVEKIVERTVEKEVIVEQGPSPEEVAAMEAQLRLQNEEARQKAEAKRREVEALRDVAESERLRLMAQIDEQEQISMQDHSEQGITGVYYLLLRFQEQQHKLELQARLSQMEMKMVQGKQIMEQAIQQEEDLKRQQRRLRKQQEREEELKRQEEQQRQENMELEEKCASQEEQVQKLTTKLQKLWDKYQKAQQEMVDIQHFNQQEREDRSR
eukprot:g19862.t1